MNEIVALPDAPAARLAGTMLKPEMAADTGAGEPRRARAMTISATAVRLGRGERWLGVVRVIVRRGAIYTESKGDGRWQMSR